MAIANVDPDTPLAAILARNSFILGELASHPLAAAYIPQFDAIQSTWFTTFTARTALEIAVDKAQGGVEGADDGLDDFVDILDRTLLIAVKNDRDAGLYTMFFEQPAHLLKRPILAEELVTCRNWIVTLQDPAVPAAVAALLPQLQVVITAADAAVTKRDTAVQALKTFDTIGGKKTLIDAFNAVCKTVHGALQALPDQQPNLMLPANFGDRFFPHESHKGVTSLTNPKDVQAVMNRLKGDLDAATAHLETLQTKAANKALQKQARAEAAARVAAAKQAAADAKQKLKDAEQALKDAKNNPPTPPTPPTPPGG